MHTFIIDPRELKYSEWNTNSVSPADMEKLQESLRRNGQFRPVIVREIDDGEYEVIGGEHTTRAAIAIGLDEVACYSLGTISDRQAKEISVLDNGRYGADDAMGLSKLLAEIGDAEDLKTFMPFGEEDLSSIFSNKDIDLDDLDFGEDEETAVPEPIESRAKTHQIMRFKVPMADAEFIENLIAKVISRQGFKSSDSLESAGDALVYIANQLSKGADLDG